MVHFTFKCFEGGLWFFGKLSENIKMNYIYIYITMISPVVLHEYETRSSKLREKHRLRV